MSGLLDRAPTADAVVQSTCSGGHLSCSVKRNRRCESVSPPPHGTPVTPSEPPSAARILKRLQTQGRATARDRDKATKNRTASFAVMRCRPKHRIQNTPVCRAFPTGQADAGTRTPDPIITRNSRCSPQGAWLREILARTSAPCAMREKACSPGNAWSRLSAPRRGGSLPPSHLIVKDHDTRTGSNERGRATLFCLGRRHWTVRLEIRSSAPVVQLQTVRPASRKQTRLVGERGINRERPFKTTRDGLCSELRRCILRCRSERESCRRRRLRRGRRGRARFDLHMRD
jgi:hypothetical protein